MNYNEFLKNKVIFDRDTGLDEIPELNNMLYDFQSDIVSWALRRGRACIFADCGMGKTPMQLEWASKVPGDVLIVAPLAVSTQTIREGGKFGVVVDQSRDGSKRGKITITNYEQLEKFNPDDYVGIVLDESSILKAYTGKYRNMIIDSFGKIQYRLACTATPAPNDFMELGNHAEFVGAMSRTEMLSMFFVHDGGETQKWRLKGHAQSEFWKWVCSWAVMIRRPSDLGYEDGEFILPRLNVKNIVVKVDNNDNTGDYLFNMPAASLQERQKARADTIIARAEKCAEIISTAPDEPWLIWCNLNNESDIIKKSIDGCVEVKGSDSAEFKENTMLAFSAGEVQKLVTKPKIAGFGMNWQHCSNVIFMGLSDSYEQYYQAIRRSWRFGQKNTVNCYIVTAETEGAVVANIERKEKDADKMADEMVRNMKDINTENIKGMKRTKNDYKTIKKEGKNWTAYLGDCVQTTESIESNSIDYSIFSPPFASLYTYSNSDRDMGNCKSDDEFSEHFQYLIKNLYRVMRPGRNVSFHCMNLPTSKARDGYIGIRDFRGDMIKQFQDEGFIFHSEVCIWKDPVTAMQRTKALGLLHKQVKKDSCMSRQGIPDYFVTMRKPGENNKPVAGEFNWFAGDESTFQNTGNLSIDIWQRYASPVWMDIRPNRTLQKQSARENNDERHICPLQLDVIERGVQLWSIEGDTVLSPFMGIGSEGFISVKLGRKFIGCELKESYYNVACNNLNEADSFNAELF